MKTFFFLNPRGPCAGVNRAITILETIVAKYPTPIFVNHEIVHNEFVVRSFEKKGVIFGVPPEEVPPGSVYVFSAHGVSPNVRKKAEERNLLLVDATCPLVQKVHHEAEYFLQKGFFVFYIGKPNHPESNGVRDRGEMTLITSKSAAENAEVPLEKREKIAVLTQTTLSVDEVRDILLVLMNRFPNLTTPKAGDVCYATQNRQEAVRKIRSDIDLLLVVGSKKSSNSQKLVRVGAESVPSFLVSSEVQIPWEEIERANRIGITSGASVPEEMTQGIFSRIREKYPNLIIKNIAGKTEDIFFPLPKM